jgi:Flp pilus assembly protein TadG
MAACFWSRPSYFRTSHNDRELAVIAEGRHSPARSIASILRDARASATIEFALVLPVMLMVFGIAVIGGEELAIGQKVTATARTVVDIISQNSVLSTSQMTAILDASAYTMAPYGSANLSIVVAEVQVSNSSGAATVTWSAAAYGGTKLTNGAPVTLPTGMAIPNATSTTPYSYYIYGVVTYNYTPLAIGFGVWSTVPLSDSSYWSPRVSPSINYPYPS